MIVLLHSSKTMRVPSRSISTRKPLLIERARELNTYLSTLSLTQISKAMHVSDKVAQKTKDLIQNWDPDSKLQLPVIDSFIGDIYSGLQVHTFDDSDRLYAENVLRIFSGLYGVLLPLDTIQPYRLEMGYRFPSNKYKNLYEYWGDSLAQSIPTNEIIINTSSDEYMKAVLPYLESSTVITPRFLTVSSKTDQPTFVVVHAKIARGAFAHWIIKNRIESVDDLPKFDELGYVYDRAQSTESEPVFICKEFGGIGLSVRLH